MPNIITSVCTTPATTNIVGEMTSVIHDKLVEQDCLPSEHYVDSAYTTADIREPPKSGSICAVLPLVIRAGKLAPLKHLTFLILRLIGPVKVQLYFTAFLVSLK